MNALDTHNRIVAALALCLALSTLLAACGDDAGAPDGNANQPADPSTATPVPMAETPIPTEAMTEPEPVVDPTEPARPEVPDEPDPDNPPAEAEADPTATPEQPASEPSSVEPAEAMDLAPEFGTIDNWYNGGPTTLAELRGSPVLLVFWADY